MSEVSRRVFLKGGSAVVAAAGAVSALPGLPALVGLVDTQGPADAGAAEAATTDTDVAAMDGPVVAHIRDLATGEIGLFTGTREITVLNPQLAASILRALR
jgi:hypothetical protein